jgi:hypothetical protein
VRDGRTAPDVNFPFIVEAHRLQGPVAFCFSVIGDTTIREANGPDSVLTELKCLRFMRLTDEQQVDQRRVARLP